jgi:hypothetical protein
MKFSEGLLRQYERAFRAYGIDISFEDEALRSLAEAAAQEETGARGLLTVFEKLFRDYKYYLAGSGLSQLRVTAELVREPKRVLDRLMAEGHEHEARALEASARQFAGKFKNEHGLEIVFDDSAIHWLVSAQPADDHDELRTPVQGINLAESGRRTLVKQRLFSMLRSQSPQVLERL